jgi:hypothetical protein
MMPAIYSEADVLKALEVTKALTPGEIRALDAFNQKKFAAEDSLRQFVEQGWDVLEPGTRFIPGMHVDAVARRGRLVKDSKGHVSECGGVGRIDVVPPKDVNQFRRYGLAGFCGQEHS